MFEDLEPRVEARPESKTENGAERRPIGPSANLAPRQEELFPVFVPVASVETGLDEPATSSEDSNLLIEAGPEPPPEVETRPPVDEPEGNSELEAPYAPPPAENEEDHEDAEPEPEPGRDALTDWKSSLREDFERWLATLDEVPAEDLDESKDSEAPDLYSFYEQLAASNAEARKGNRRTAEVLSQWGDILTRFDGDIRQLRQYFSQVPSTSEKAEALPRAACLGLVEMLDRMRRLTAAFDIPPAKSWWAKDRALRKAWETQQQGFDILVSHLESFLNKEGVARIEALGKPFDPAVMVAVATEPSPNHPHHTVLEEVAVGYHRHGELLRAAQVKVSL